MIDIVAGWSATPDWLFFLFVAEGTKIGDEIFGLGFLQDIREGRHSFTALKNLSSNLVFAEAAAYAGEIGTFVTALFADGMAVLAAVVREDLGSAGALLGGCGVSRQRGCDCER